MSAAEKKRLNSAGDETATATTRPNQLKPESMARGWQVELFYIRHSLSG